MNTSQTHIYQSNAPELDEILSPNNSFNRLARSRSSPFAAMDFKTPKAPKAAASRIDRTSSRQENLNVSNEANTSAPARSECVPTAHVYPSPAQPQPAAPPHRGGGKQWVTPPGNGRTSGGVGGTEFHELAMDMNDTLAASTARYAERDPVIENCRMTRVIDNKQTYDAARQFGGAVATSYYPGATYPAPHAAYSAQTFTTTAHYTPSNHDYGGRDLTSGVVHSEPAVFSSMDHDLGVWQRRHQDALRRQHMDQAKVLHHHGVAAGPGGLYEPVLLLPPGGGDPHRLDAIKQAADNIIKEKDNIIERQRAALADLERRGGSEAEVNRALVRKLQQDNEALQMRMQELEYQKATLRSQVAEARGGVASQRDSLERKLGETEYELREVQISTEKEISAKLEEIRELQKQVSSHDATARCWQERHASLKTECDALTDKVASLERYLADLPTTDEKQRAKDEARSVREDRSKWRSRAGELDRRLQDAARALQDRDATIARLEEAGRRAEQDRARWAEERAVLEAEITRLKGPDAEDMDELRDDNRRLRGDLSKARKLVEGLQQKAASAESRWSRERDEAARRLQQEEAAVGALRAELTAKTEHLKKLRQNTKELGSTNQDLVEKNLALTDRVKELERLHGSDTAKLERRLLKELSICFAELQSLVQICVEKAEGGDPNISALLGVKGSASSDSVAAGVGEDSAASLRYRVDAVRALRADVDTLRDSLSQRWAEDMGDNLNCVQQ